MFPETTDEAFEAVWSKVDADGDGNLTVQELAKFYGFQWDDSTSAEMTDEQILEALMMQSALSDLEAQKAKPEEEKTKEPPKEAAKDATIKMINTDGKKVRSSHGAGAEQPPPAPLIPRLLLEFISRCLAPSL
jgi:hypothetical protein